MTGDESPRRIATLGECMVEIGQREDGLWRRGFAGDTFNAAYYLRRLLPPSWEVGYVSAVGADALSDEMLRFMEGEGVATGRILRRADRTVGLYTIALRDGERSFAYWRGQSAARLLAADPAALGRALEGLDALHLSAISVAILEGRGRETLLEALGEADARGTRISFDTNHRPALWADAEEARAWTRRFAGAAHLVLPSRDDDAALHGPAEPEAILERYLGLGAEEVVLTDGPGACHGAAARGAERAHLPPGAPVVPVDTTAAGDAFGAAYLARRLAGAPLGEAMAAAQEVARRVIAHRGALVPVEGA